MNKLVFIVCACALLPIAAQEIDFAKERKATVKHWRFVGDHREESMWSALYGAKSGKIYVGLCTHAEAAHFYEFDQATESSTPQIQGMERGAFGIIRIDARC